MADVEEPLNRHGDIPEEPGSAPQPEPVKPPEPPAKIVELENVPKTEADLPAQEVTAEERHEQALPPVVKPSTPPRVSTPTTLPAVGKPPTPQQKGSTPPQSTPSSRLHSLKERRATATPPQAQNLTGLPSQSDSKRAIGNKVSELQAIKEKRQQQQQQQQTMEDKLKLLVQHMAGGSSQTSSGNTNILQLIQLLEKQQQSTTPDVQQQPTPQAMQQQQLASLASSLLGGGAPGLETSSSNEVQLKLAQQLLQQQQPQPQQDPLQARLAQLQKLNVADQMKGHANQQALDILALLTAQQPQDPLAMRGSGAPASTNLSAAAALQQLQLAAQAGLDIGAPAHHSTVAPQPSASDAMALLAAALNNNVGTAAPEATSHSTGSSAGGSSMLSEPMNSFPVDQAVLDQNSLAALLQQSGLMQQSSLPAAAPTVSNVQPQQLSNLQSLLTSLSLGSTSSGGGAASEASAESAPVPAPAQDKRPPSTGVTEQVEPASASTSRKSTTDDITLGSDATVAVQAPTMSTKQLLQQPANFPAAALAALAASGGDKALMGLCADLSGGKQDMFRNAKVLLESLSLLQGGSIDTSGAGGDVSTSIPGSAMTGGGPSVEEVSAAMNRNNSFDK
mmetsp:Transcript_28424/g.62491  ORF Transcript_28424/g.62491 Transcript_28424/m.62491 type:complete len:620 (+) Transcript_28424:200-2059(+)